VGLVLSNTTPATVTSIMVVPAKRDRIEGVVTGYSANSSISITAPGATMSTAYGLTSATTIVGLAAGATVPIGAHVGLVLSSTTPATVTSIMVGVKGEGKGFDDFGAPRAGMGGSPMPVTVGSPKPVMTIGGTSSNGAQGFGSPMGDRSRR
ncbi:MAG: hypothetical protein HKL85_11645, partial [Acidimicrobiaceae bacterium]|nr:hypothetical protein [Acidimicrobiaceae bacterium]